MKKKNVTRFLVVQVEGPDEMQVDALTEKLSALINTAVVIQDSTKYLDIEFVPSVRVIRGKG